MLYSVPGGLAAILNIINFQNLRIFRRFWIKIVRSRKATILFSLQLFGWYLITKKISF